MARVREHDPVIIEEINGLWNRGDPETCPSDHLLMADDINFIHSGVRTRSASEPYLAEPLTDGVGGRYDMRRLVRMYNYVTQTSNTIIALEIRAKTSPLTGFQGRFYQIFKTNPIQVRDIGIIDDIDDFAMITIANRAYISPIKYFQDPSGNWYGLGKPGESVYVYDGSSATSWSSMRKAAGGIPSNGGKKPLIAYNDEKDGKVTAGIHLFAVAFNDGQVQMSLRPAVDAPGGKMVRLDNIPIGPSPATTSRTLVMTKAVVPFAPSQDNRMYKVITIPDNTTTSFLIDIDDAGLTTEYVPGATAGPPVDMMFVAQTAEAGFCDPGLHLFGVVYESDTGYLSPPGPEFFPLQTLVDGTKKVTAINIPFGPANTVRRHLVATHTIPDFYSGDQKGYQFFFIPKAVLENNTATSLDFSFYDSDLVSDASHLIDNYTTIPACVNFCTYHSRLVMVGFSDYPKKPDGTTDDTSHGDNRSVALLSAPGEPEAVSKVDGLIVTPLDGKPLTNCEQFRDILYLFKASRTYGYSDNNDEPGTWEEKIVDQGVGAPIHGIAEVLDSGGVNIDYLLVADYSGLLLFNGTYARPELSFKVEDMWMGQGRSHFHKLQLVNDSIGKKIWILPALPLDGIYRNTLYHIDYANGLEPKSVRWARWNFALPLTSILLVNTDQLAISMWQQVIPGSTSGNGLPPYLIRPGGKIIVDGQIIWEDEIDPYPPFPPVSTDDLEGGIMIGWRSNQNKHDNYRAAADPHPSVNVPIRAHIRTAYLGD